MKRKRNRSLPREIKTCEPMPLGEKFRRPGVSDDFLAAAGCLHVDLEECARQYGFKGEGIAIPFRHLNGSPIIDRDRHFARIRLYQTTDEQKYHQRPGSEVHIYIPPNFRDTPKGCALYLVEGEFKALALAEAGFAALGLCGLTGAIRTNSTNNGEHRHCLSDELADLLEVHRPAKLLFVGDADVVLNARFATEAAKLRRLVFGVRRFAFVESLQTIKPPVNGPKGIDDCRALYGDGFNAWVERLLAGAFDIPPKATAAELFAEFLQRELRPIRKLLGGCGHDARRARAKLLQSASQLWNETGAKLDLKPLLATALAVKESEVPGLVRDATNKKQREYTEAKKGTGEHHGHRVELPDVEPWPDSVDGAMLLNGLAAEYECFLWLPKHGATILACYTLYTHVWRSFEYAPILAVTSPTPGCGKGRVLDVLQKLVSNPWRTGNPTEAVLFRIIHERAPVCLIDEFDSLLKETRAAITNILNQAFHISGRVHRVEGERERKVVEFQCFCPNVVACIKTNTFGRATVTRCIQLRMQKKSRKRKVQRLRKYDGTVWHRKCLKWVLDNHPRIEGASVEFPEALDDRSIDIWEPLFVVAQVAGGEWPERILKAALDLCGEDTSGEVEDTGVSVLRWFKIYFGETGKDRVSSKVICEWFNKRAEAGFKDWREGRGIDERSLSRLLRPFEIQSHNIAVGHERPKGYLREWFPELWEAHLPPETVTADRYSATHPTNIGESDDFESATQVPSSGSKKCVSTNETGQSSAVADSGHGKAEAEKKLLLAIE